MPSLSGTKRKSDASSPTAKRVRTSDVGDTVDAILADPTGYEIPDDEDDIRDLIISIAKYAKGLRKTSTSGGSTSTTAASMTKEQIEVAAEKVRKAARSGIRKQMTWKPSCKTGSAKFVYDGVCAERAVFGEVLNIGSNFTWKMKKIPASDLQDALGTLEGSTRYNTLRITSAEVNVRYSDNGEFKITGSYGI